MSLQQPEYNKYGVEFWFPDPAGWVSFECIDGGDGCYQTFWIRDGLNGDYFVVCPCGNIHPRHVQRGAFIGFPKHSPTVEVQGITTTQLREELL